MNDSWRRTKLNIQSRVWQEYTLLAFKVGGEGVVLSRLFERLPARIRRSMEVVVTAFIAVGTIVIGAQGASSNNEFKKRLERRYAGSDYDDVRFHARPT